MKNSRLFEILYLLMEHQELTASWLSRKLEVSQRTIYRDIDALSAAGIPVYCQKGKNGGIRLMKQFQIDRSLLDDTEQDSLLTALQSLAAIKVLDSSALISRLSSLFQKKPVDWLEVDFDNWGSRPGEKTCFEQCKEAIFSHRLLSFTYYNSSGEQSCRTAEPIRLCYKGGNWYLYAYCRTKQDFRLFRLNRIKNLESLPETFSPRETVVSPSPVSSSGAASDTVSDTATHTVSEASSGPSFSAFSSSDPVEMIPLRIQFTPAAAYQVMDFFLPEEIEFFPDGTFIVRTAMPPGRWVLSFLLSFGKEAKLLEPAWLQELIQKESSEIQKLYEI